MYIHGLQKLTLLDFPGTVACTVFLAGCNMRCPYCHNSELIADPPEPVCDDRELLSFLSGRRSLLDGVCVTGGEPLIHPGIEDLLSSIRELGYRIKVDTNGTRPDVLSRILEKGLADYVAMDIKNSPDRYPVTVGREDFDLSPVRESVRILLEDRVDYEFRTTVLEQLHDERSFEDIALWIDGAKRYFLQPFTDRDTVRYAGLTAPDKEKLLAYAEIVRSHAGSVDIRGIE